MKGEDMPLSSKFSERRKSKQSREIFFPNNATREQCGSKEHNYSTKMISCRIECQQNRYK